MLLSTAGSHASVDDIHMDAPSPVVQRPALVHPVAVAVLICSQSKVPDGPYQKWWRFLLVLRMWSLVFNVSMRAQESLLKVLTVMLPHLFADPLSNHMVNKVLGLDSDAGGLVDYLCCPRCHKLYRVGRGVTFIHDRVDGSLRSLRCNGFLIKNHERKDQRVCNEVLMRSTRVRKRSGATEAGMIPFMTYVHRPIKHRLCELLARPGFAAKCHQWRSRSVPSDMFGDIMDGAVWREFGTLSLKDNDGKPIRVPFLDEIDGHNYPLSIFVDWFQPWRRVQYSVGVIFMSVLSLPREERNKKENVLLVGIIPGGSEKHMSLNPFLEPIVQDLLELHPAGSGVTMATHDKPEGTRVTACLICGVCDLPASKKLAGFVGHNGNKGCSRCEKSWSSTQAPVRSENKEDGPDLGDEDEVFEDELPAEKEDEDKDENDEQDHESKEEKKEGKDNPESAVAERDAQPEEDEDEEDEDGAEEKKVVRRGKNVVRNWRRVYAGPADMGKPRVLDSHRRRALQWLNAPSKKEQERLARKFGVKYSSLLRLDYWDPIRFMVVDSLHAFWLGVCRSLMTMWRDRKWKKGSKHLSIMQARLDAMRVPADVCRLLNKWSSNMSGLTGHQVKAFVGCFSTAVFVGFLSEQEEKLWTHLVIASRILSLHLITGQEIDAVRLSAVVLFFRSLLILLCPVSGVRDFCFSF